MHFTLPGLPLAGLLTLLRGPGRPGGGGGRPMHRPPPPHHPGGGGGGGGFPPRRRFLPFRRAGGRGCLGCAVLLAFLAVGTLATGVAVAGLLGG